MRKFKYFLRDLERAQGSFPFQSWWHWRIQMLKVHFRVRARASQLWKLKWDYNGVSQLSTSHTSRSRWRWGLLSNYFLNRCTYHITHYDDELYIMSEIEIWDSCENSNEYEYEQIKLFQFLSFSVTISVMIIYIHIFYLKQIMLMVNNITWTCNIMR